jgi:hypothetical protein
MRIILLITSYSEVILLMMIVSNRLDVNPVNPVDLDEYGLLTEAHKFHAIRIYHLHALCRRWYYFLQSSIKIKCSYLFGKLFDTMDSISHLQKGLRIGLHNDEQRRGIPKLHLMRYQIILESI